LKQDKTTTCPRCLVGSHRRRVSSPSIKRELIERVTAHRVIPTQLAPRRPVVAAPASSCGCAATAADRGHDRHRKVVSTTGTNRSAGSGVRGLHREEGQTLPAATTRTRETPRRSATINGVLYESGDYAKVERTARSTHAGPRARCRSTDGGERLTPRGRGRVEGLYPGVHALVVGVPDPR